MIEMEFLHHVSLSVRDLKRSHRFYSDLLGFKQIERPPFDSIGVWYAIGTQQLHLLQNPQGETLRSGPIDTIDGHFAVWVTSFAATIAALEAAGLAYEARPDSLAGFSQIFLLDPDHNIIEFDAAYGS